MKTIDRDKFQFESTGRKAYAYGLQISLGADLDAMYGHDGTFECSDEESPELNKQEREELADYMIGLWTNFKESEPIDKYWK